ncbi:MAG: hypothetical protein WAU89_23465 [Candidatus Acidiferrales bacterium]
MRYLAVKNFETFQHYKDRATFSWIRLYASLLSDYDFQSLPDKSKAHLMLIWLLVSQRNDRRIPDDPRWVAQKIGATDKVDLKNLIASGWLIALDETYQTKNGLVQDPSYLISSPLPDLSSGSDLESWFENEFVPVYPEDRRVQHKTAIAWLKGSKPDEHERTRILGALALWVASPEWTRDEGKYIPGMGKFLRDGWHLRQPRAAPNGQLNLTPARQKLLESIQRSQLEEAARNGTVGSEENPAESRRHLDAPADGRRGAG